MSVNQSFVSNLLSNINNDLISAVDFNTVKSLNGIEDIDLKKDINKLKTLKYILSNWDVNLSYHSDSFILKIDREYSNYCKFKPSKQFTGSTTAVKRDENLLRERQYNYNSSIIVSSGIGRTLVSLQETPKLYVKVLIDGVPMRIGDGDSNKDIFFADCEDITGANPRELKDIQVNDILFYNRDNVKTDLLTTSEIQINIV